jgi:hypothetical protein
MTKITRAVLQHFCANAPKIAAHNLQVIVHNVTCMGD